MGQLQKAGLNRIGFVAEQVSPQRPREELSGPSA
jgi:hypothetical protein